MADPLGEGKRVDLRAVWPLELDFSGWLRKHIDVLNEELRWVLDAEHVQQEVSAGALRVDLLAQATEPGTGKRFSVVIENQLGTTDDSHLAGVMAYTAAFKAKGAIWIAGNVDPVYIDVMNWLNENSTIDAYLFKVETICIDESRPAPIFRKVVGPASTRRIDPLREQQKQQVRNWWDRVLPYLAAVHPAWGSVKAIVTFNPSVPIPDAPQALRWYVEVGSDSSEIGILIVGETKEINDHYFNELARRKDAIHRGFGGPLEWPPRKGPSHWRWVSWRNPEPGGFANDADVQKKAAVFLAEAMKRLVGATEQAARDVAEPTGAPTSTGKS